jgi:MerR family transcriptional regulator/heat shock protein HspR
MDKEFWTIEEAVAVLKMERDFLEELEREEIICPTCTEDVPEKSLSAYELEKAYLARLLMEEMDVNLPGVEVILRMRENMLSMRRQFDRILDDISREIHKRLLSTDE